MTARLMGRRGLLQISALALTMAIVGMSPARAADTTIAVIVKDTTSFFFQIVLAGARQAGKDLGVNVSELGTSNEADVAGQIAVLENAAAGKPAVPIKKAAANRSPGGGTCARGQYFTLQP